MKTLLRLFDTLIAPIALYGSEMFAFALSKSEARNLFVCQNKWARALIGVPGGTPACGVFRELAINQLSTLAKIRCLKFFLNISTVSRERLVYKALKTQMQLAENNKPCWGLLVKNALNVNGLGFLWNEYPVGQNLASRKAVLERRLKDTEIPYLEEEMDSYKQFRSFGRSHLGSARPTFYDAAPFSVYSSLARFRLNCVWSLPITRGTEDSYKCTRCGVSFLKTKTWNHFLRECKEFECCLGLDRDPNSCLALSVDKNSKLSKALSSFFAKLDQK